MILDIVADLVVLACGAIFIKKNKHVIKEIKNDIEKKAEEYRDSIKANKQTSKQQ